MSDDDIGRRPVLKALGSGSVAGLAGCVDDILDGDDDTDDTSDDTPTQTPDETTPTPTPVEYNPELTLQPSEDTVPVGEKIAFQHHINTEIDEDEIQRILEITNPDGQTTTADPGTQHSHGQPHTPETIGTHTATLTTTYQNQTAKTEQQFLTTP